MVYVFMPRSNDCVTWRNKKKNGRRNVVRFGRSGSLELPAKCIEKTYDYNATCPYDKPEKILKSPELKKRKYV